VHRARDLRPGIALGADLIAGFPTETEALFRETLDFVTAAELPFLHVFPYSQRPGTPAARMPAVPVALRRERAARLRAAGRDLSSQFFARQLGRSVSVLTESGDAGHTEHFAPVRLDARAEPARLVAGIVTRATAEGLMVRIAGGTRAVETRGEEGERRNARAIRSVSPTSGALRRHLPLHGRDTEI
jgi:threonylcarbamoyladenosine tRNA methylthiotransferase MtaB